MVAVGVNDPRVNALSSPPVSDRVKLNVPVSVISPVAGLPGGGTFVIVIGSLRLTENISVLGGTVVVDRETSARSTNVDPDSTVAELTGLSVKTDPPETVEAGDGAEL